MKWQPVAAMLALIALALWLVLGDAGEERLTLAAGERAIPLRLGTSKGWLIVQQSSNGDSTYQVRFAGETALTRAFTNREAVELLGPMPASLAIEPAQNWVFKLLNITSWTGVGWVVIGFLGQALFFARMMMQWLASERRRESVIPLGFWWLSLAGGVMLFAYFVWRRDIVGVLGQTTGVVVYVRNLRLIYARRRMV